uniref:Uncharacterized protein n=1 Tax=Strombidium inclinatum TaxID=197538 RepID=A0A7S3IH02_9SPIT|mmetsp:Transcript_16913/g.26028  ORF Transcript_16913/g.26028 Transcript_16913/m.26028 type:complete len:115 (+) Transcript_16913:312-656(+)
MKCLLDIASKHPRDFFNTGRVKVQLIDEKTGEPVNSEIGTNKRKLLEMMASKFPEAQVKYNEVLEGQKKVQEEKKAEIARLQEQARAMQGGPKPDEAKKEEDGGAKKKKKKGKK